MKNYTFGDSLMCTGCVSHPISSNAIPRLLQFFYLNAFPFTHGRSESSCWNSVTEPSRKRERCWAAWTVRQGAEYKAKSRHQITGILLRLWSESLWAVFMNRSKMSMCWYQHIWWIFGYISTTFQGTCTDFSNTGTAFGGHGSAFLCDVRRPSSGIQPFS